MRFHVLTSGFLVTVIACAGCKPSPPGPAAAPSSPPTAPAATAANAEIPAELVQKIDELVRATKEYNALAEKVTNLDEYRQQMDALRVLGDQISTLVEDIMIAESKLTPSQKAELDRVHFEGRVKPIKEERTRHMQRLGSLR